MESQFPQIGQLTPFSHRTQTDAHRYRLVIWLAHLKSAPIISTEQNAAAFVIYCEEPKQSGRRNWIMRRHARPERGASELIRLVLETEQQHSRARDSSIVLSVDC